MSVSFKYILLVLLSTINVGEATGDVTKQQSGTATAKTFTDVVSLDFCESHLHAEDKMGKKTFQEVYAYAETPPRHLFPNLSRFVLPLWPQIANTHNWQHFSTF